MKINETSWGGMVRRSNPEKQVRKEDISDFQWYLRNIEWVDMGSSRYLYAKFDFPYSEYHQDGCSLNEIIEIQKQLPKDVHIMTRSNLNFLKSHRTQFREINTDISWGCSAMCPDHNEKIYFSAREKKYQWSNFIVAHKIDHPLEDYCVSTDIDLYNSRTGEHQFFKTPENILTVNMKSGRNTLYMFTEKCLGFKLVKDKKINESVLNETSWGGMVRRSSPEGGVRIEDELSIGKVEFIKNQYIYLYSHNLAYYDKNDVVNPDVDDACKFIRDRFSRGEKYMDDVISHIKRNWKKGENYFELIRNMVNDTRADVFKTGFKKNHNECIADTLYNWWNSFEDYGDKTDMLVTHNVDINTDDDAEAIDAKWDELPWEKSLEIYNAYNGQHNLNETSWGGMVRRSSSDVLRKEDELDGVNKRALDKYIEHYTDKDGFDGYKVSGNDKLNSFEHYVFKYRDLFRYMKEYEGYKISIIIDYVKNNWDKGANIKKRIEDMYSKNTLNETSWGGMVRRSEDKEIRKEDELSDRQVESIKMWMRGFIDSIFFYESYESTLEDCIKYWHKNFHRIESLSLDEISSHIKRNWNKGDNYEMFINDGIDKNEEMLKKHNFKRVPNETIDDTLTDFWGDLSYSDKYEILTDCGYEVTQGGWDYDDGSCDECWDNITWEERIEIYVDNQSLNETSWGGMVRRSSGEIKREEDKLSDDDRKCLDKYIEMFAELYTDDDYIARNGGYEQSMPDFLSFVKDFANNVHIERLDPNVKAICDYVKDNWENGENIMDKIDKSIREIEIKNGIDECDAVAPNGGLTFSDVSGMGPILFPGECGEKGSGDLPMPSGKIYKQVAPFDSFIKKKKKKKKFRKEDEPCAKYSNPDVYKHVDDFRTYVDRTFDKMK